MKELKALFTTLYPNNKAYIKFRNFYRFYLTVYVLLAISYMTFGKDNAEQQPDKMNKIEVGHQVPLFSLKDQNGKMFHIKDWIGKKNLVIYFYPKDDSPGCTKQACSFQDQYEQFKKVDAKIIGISAQSVESHKKFAEKYQLDFTLLSDEHNEVRKLFGVPSSLFGLLPGRVTYIIDKTGTVIYTFNSQTQTTKHVDESIRILRKLPQNN